jgi:chromate transporter
MATYVGFTAAGVPGAVIATLGEVTPSIIVILIVAILLKNFRNNRYVNMAFYGLRPASTGLIGAACVAVIFEVLTSVNSISENGVILNRFVVPAGEALLNWKGGLLAVGLVLLTNRVKVTKDFHPIVFIAISAIVGILFRF